MPQAVKLDFSKAQPITPTLPQSDVIDDSAAALSANFARNKSWSKPGPYVTKLNPDEERQFQVWVRQNKIPWQDSPTADYDMRGYWKAMASGDPNAKRAANLHFPDTWKTPYDATFSNQSQYATSAAPHWEGDKLVRTQPVKLDFSKAQPLTAATPAKPKTLSQRIASYEAGTGAGPALARVGSGTISFFSKMLDPRVPVIGNTRKLGDKVYIDPNSMIGVFLSGLPEEAQQAKELWKQPGLLNKVQASGHEIASVIPMLGPLAADAAKRLTNGDVRGGLVELGVSLLGSKAGVDKEKAAAGEPEVETAPASAPSAEPTAAPREPLALPPAPERGVEAAKESAPSARQSAVSEFLGKAMLRQAREAIGQGVLDDMEERDISPRAVTQQFWDDTYYSLPADQQAYFRSYLKRVTGFKPGDVIGIDANKQPIVAQDWADIANNILDISDNPEHLEGSTRGLVALMKTYNDRFAERRLSEGVSPTGEERRVGTPPPIDPIRAYVMQQYRKVLADPAADARDKAYATDALARMKAEPFEGVQAPTTALARRVSEGQAALTEQAPTQARFIRSGQLGNEPPTPTPPQEGLANVPPQGPPPAPPSAADAMPDHEIEQFTKSTLLQRTAQAKRAIAVGAHAFKDAWKQFNRRTPEQNLEFMYGMDEGYFRADPFERRVGEEFRNALTSLRKEMQRLDPDLLRNYYENYWPREWKMPGVARSIIDQLRGRESWRSLKGRKSFLRARTLVDPITGAPVSMREAVERYGMEPVSNNPVDIFALKTAEMHRFIAGQRILDDLKSQGLKQTFHQSPRNPAPEGWSQYDPRYAGADQWGPDPAVKTLNRFMEPGLFSQGRNPALNTAFDMVRRFNAVTNQALVSLSLFHVGLTATSSIVGDVAQAMRFIPSMLGSAVKGDFAESYNSLEAATRRLSTDSFIGNMMKMNKLYRAYLEPGSLGPEMERLIQTAMKGGMKPQLADIYRTDAMMSFRKSVQDRSPWGMAKSGIPALLQWLSGPIMRWWVPRLKLMATLQSVKGDLELLGPNATDAQIRDAAMRSVQSVEDWYGQMDPDNLVISHGFWSRNLADAMSVAFKFVEFSYGTLRGMYGAAGDTNMLRKGQLTPRLARAIAFPFMIYTMGATVQYLMTGKGPEQSDTPIKDGFEPRTGRVNPDGTPERLNLPTYWRTAVQWFQPVLDMSHGDMDSARIDLGRAITNRLSGGVDSLVLLATNKDFYGREVFQSHITSPRWERPFEQLGDYAKAVARDQLQPISFRYAEQAHEKGEKLPTEVERFVGLQPVSAAEGRTRAENLISRFLSENMGARALTPDEYAARRARAVIREQIRSGKSAPTLGTQISERNISPSRLMKFMEDAHKDFFARTEELTPEQFLQVWEIASPEERTKMKLPLFREYRRLLTGPVIERNKLWKPFQQALAEAR